MIKNLKYVFFVIFVACSLQLNAAVDSLGIKTVAGQKFILHKVEAKETLYSIARRYHVSVSEITKVNEAEKDGYSIDQIGRILLIPFKPEEISEPKKTIEISDGSQNVYRHVVEAGETLYSLSKKYGVTPEQLKEWNSLESNTLAIGQELIIKSTKTAENETVGEETNVDAKYGKTETTEHIVDFGETIYSISRQYDVAQEDIMAWNRLKDANISVGQKLLIKSEKPATKEEKKEVKVQVVVQKVHNAKRGEDYKSVAVLYGLKPADLKKWNAFKAPFKGGEVIKLVPTKGAEVSTKKQQDNIAVDPRKVHVVASGETVFSLADKYGVDMEDLRRWNSMDNYQLSVGQKLYITNPDTMSAVVETTENNTEDLTKLESEEERFTEKVIDDNPQKKDTKALFTVDEEDVPKIEKVKEKGVAEVIAGSEGTEKYLALHRTAKIGTIMQVRNDLNDQIVFVRVLGKLPDTGVDKKVIIRISKKAFEKLGGVDYKFPVEISYLPLKD